MPMQLCMREVGWLCIASLRGLECCCLSHHLLVVGGKDGVHWTCAEHVRRHGTEHVKRACVVGLQAGARCPCTFHVHHPANAQVGLALTSPCQQ
ncbi:hypothetical protein COO60DRAFT_1479176 [Scenedesmus sp. NREL 46B-D3]|nr:hypothetical protein COO60DRAFT_1479176 [Scenedesmus sp. NREL 46B-D3]